MSPRACFENSNSILTLLPLTEKTSSGGKFLGPGSRWVHRPWSPISPTSGGKNVSGMAARMWSACVQEIAIFFRQNWTSAQRNQMEASTVKNVGRVKWWTNCGEAAGEAAGEEVSWLAGLMKGRKSNSGVTNVATATSSLKRLRRLSQTRRSGYLNLFNNTHIYKLVQGRK